jgi:hypothetical protein
MLFAAPSTALAQARQPSTPSLGDSLKGDAKAAYDEARRLFKAGDYKGSLAALERAQKLSPDPRLFWNMAACENKLGHHAKAISLVEKYLAAGGAVLSDAEKKEATEFIVAMQTLVATVTIASALEGVELTVDDELAGTTPFAKPIYVEAGEHRLRLAHAGYKTLTRTETVPAGAALTWSLEMQKDEGRLVVTAGSGESIWLDGTLVGTTQWGGNVASGTHTVLVTASGKKSREQSIDVHGGDVKSLDVHLEESSGSSTKWLLIGGGVVLAAGAAVGGYFLFKNNGTPAQPDPKGTLGTFSFP